ncbi:hypothetical protein TRIUR3_07290 [Triticum urartu]|uniref:Uncharacterized protein n=1 Tax=Triticum urartu TaxID=4572 RepID=M8AKJ5_TRIUA|nr:hypothetical protein TRIUR3_07290 [Triticum urartu]
MAMRGNNVKALAMMLVVVGLVALEQTQQAQASHCCCPLGSVDTYFKCREKSDSTVSDCCGASAGYISDAAGFECKSDYIDIETALQGVSNVVVGKGSFEMPQQPMIMISIAKSRGRCLIVSQTSSWVEIPLCLFGRIQFQQLKEKWQSQKRDPKCADEKSGHTGEDRFNEGQFVSSG